MPCMASFLQARDLLVRHRDDYASACREFEWPKLDSFNWALDYFDAMARGNTRVGLHVVDDAGQSETLTFADLSERSNRVANFLRKAGVARGDRILIMLGNVVPLWEITLAAMKLGAVFSPATAMLTTDDLQDRIDRGEMRHVIAEAASTAKFDDVKGKYTRIVVGGTNKGWLPYTHDTSSSFTADGVTRGDDPLLLYFTSGTTAKPKMVLHTHVSYPAGHLSTMYWIGVREGDVHWNISSPGWAKHAWSSTFAPWNAGATVFGYQYARFEPRRALDTIVRCRVTTLCAPPTVWRMLVGEDLGAWPVALREVVGAGEPLNPEVIERVRRAWGLTIRDGYGQTETTAQVGNPPGQPVKPGSMGRPLPGYRVRLVDPATGDASDTEGELCLELGDPDVGDPAWARPVPLMTGYQERADAFDEEQNARAFAGGVYHTGDVVSRDPDGYLSYVGRADDVFKASDYRI